MTTLPIKTKLTIFDIDGTLTDSVAIHQQAFRKALEDAELMPYDNNFSNYKHHTDRYISNTIFFEHHGRDMTDEDIARFENDVYRLSLDLLQGKPFAEISGAVAFVQYLHWHTPYAIAYATGSFHQPAQNKLSIGFPNYLESMLFSCNRQPVREEIIQEAIKASKYIYQVPHFEEIIAFGDGIWDWKAAQSLGIDFIGIGSRSRTIFANCSCRGCYDDFHSQQVLLRE
ncbi:HAD hydrolase-like protein [Scytonema sp. UIC 10036]|uniref:HAD family hydrolase n=1 Tax=Scytonema sp. UIC 10036 TaxID=2304196 RepID=UPI0012DAC346|nr:HAD family hydrolase [Scytonema sp. UIC 10036]MUG93545.1 HAD hydrolase-like protein [Scytonema sp. UIC 10036]